MSKQSREEKTAKSPQVYSEGFKRMIVSEYESGKSSKAGLKRKYGISGNSCIPRWLKKYGKFDHPTYTSKGRPLKDIQKRREKELEQSIRSREKELEKQLALKEAELQAYKQFISIAERELNIKIGKKVWRQAVQEIAKGSNLSVPHLSRLFGYSKQAYYKRTSTKTNISHKKELKSLVLAVKHQLPKCGGRKIHHIISKKLKAQGVKVGRDKLFDFLRDENLLAYKRKKYHKTTNSKHWMRKYPNQIKDLEIIRPEQVWVADITYLQVKKKHYYLHLITDAYSKKIMGYQLANNMMTIETTKALEKALDKRIYTEKLIHHSDRGLQYCSKEYTDLLKSNHIEISMTENSDPYENAVAERINGILKDEFGMDHIFEDFYSMNKQLDEAIHIYNGFRPHLSIHLNTPNRAHLQQKMKIKTYKNKKGSKLVLNP
ncbi:MAG: IS3 family transposase [Bacteroidetes bacterium]|nr:IS3 family transposase [Bacteroidota bacterium]